MRPTLIGNFGRLIPQGPALDRQKMKWADPVRKLGLIARGVVFVLIGLYSIIEAIYRRIGQPS
jgi:hypothetical protein